MREYTAAWFSKIGLDPPDIDEMIGTKGPANRFNNALFIEKEGFSEILADARFPERYSMALMSTKGIPVAAACDLIEALVNKGVRVFVLHDFDLAGFKILRTLREGTRLSVGSDVIDLGLRMADIEGLPAEPVYYNQATNPRVYLKHDCGATQEEADFLVSASHYRSYQGQRVEINAMTSEQLIEWLDRKFAEHNVTKLIPDAGTIAEAYKRAMFLNRIQAKIEEFTEEIEGDDTDIPDGLRERVTARMANDPIASWDRVVWDIANDNDIQF